MTIVCSNLIAVPYISTLITHGVEKIRPQLAQELGHNLLYAGGKGEKEGGKRRGKTYRELNFVKSNIGTYFTIE